MRNGLIKLTLCAVAMLALGLVLAACGEKKEEAKVVKLGFNIELTGDIPKVGEASKYAAEIVLAEVNGAGGLDIGGQKYPLEFVYQDNEAKPESAVSAQLKLITQDKVLGIVGPQSSKQAVPAGGVADENKTPIDLALVHQPQHHPEPSPSSSARPSSIPSRPRWRPTSRPSSSMPRPPRSSSTCPTTTPRAWPRTSRPTSRASSAPARWWRSSPTAPRTRTSRPS